MKRAIRLHRPAFLLLIVALLLPTQLLAGDLDRTLTIYTRDLAMVSETHSVSVDKGMGDLSITGILPALKDGSIHVEVVKGSDVMIHSIQFNNNLFDLDKYWASRVGEVVTVTLDDTSMTGQLKRATSSNLFLELESELVPLSRSTIDKNVRIAELPDGLVTEPTLTLHYSAKKGGERTIQLTYLVDGINWQGVHRVDLNDNTPIVTPGFVITNTTGDLLEYSSLDLVAGDIHLSGDKRRVDRLNPKPGATAGDKTSKTGDLRHWPITTPGSLTLGTTSLHPLGELAGKDVERYYVYDATIFDDRASAKLAFSLPAALPGGVVRVFEQGQHTSMFTGEDTIDDTPAGSTLELTLGQVFDLSAERIRMAEGADEDGGTVQGVKVVLGNSGGEMATIRVLERLFGDWTITLTEGSDAATYQRVDARMARFDVPVGAGQTKTVSYEIRYAR